MTLATGNEQSKEVEDSQSVLNENEDDTLLSYSLPYLSTHLLGPWDSLSCPPSFLPEQVSFSVIETEKKCSQETQDTRMSLLNSLSATCVYFFS